MLKNTNTLELSWLASEESEDTPDLILGIRVVGRRVSVGLNKSGTKEKFRALTATEVMNLHLAKLDAGWTSVFFSIDLPVAAKMIPHISRVLLFSDEDDWKILCHAEIFRASRGENLEFVPTEADDSNQVAPWINVPAKTWLLLQDYVEVDDEYLRGLRLLNGNRSGSETFYDLIHSSKRFNRVYCLDEGA